MDRQLERHFRRFRRHGDVAALARVFDLSSAELGRVATFLVRDRATAEDIVQATYLTAIEKCASYDASQRLLPWLLGILARHAARAREAAARQPDPERLDPGASEDPAEAASRAELGELVTARIRALPATYARAVEAYLSEGRPPRDIGRELGLSAGTVSVRLHRGLALLRRSLPAGAGLSAAAPALDLGAVRARVLSTLPPGGAAVTTSAASLTITTLMLKHPLFVALLSFLLGAGTWHLATREGPAAAPASAPEVTTTGSLARPPEVDADAPAAAPASSPERSELRVETPATDLAGGDAEAWLRRVNSAPSSAAARAVFAELAAIDAAAGREILEAIYSRVEDPDYRRQAFRAFLEAGHAHTLAALHLGTRDDDLECRAAALDALGRIAYEDFASHFEDYGDWRERQGSRAYAEVLASSARDLVRRAAELDDAATVALLKRFDRPELRFGEWAGVDLAAVLRAAGIDASLLRWVRLDDLHARRAAVRWARDLALEDVLRGELELWVRGAELEQRIAGLRYLSELEPSEDYLRQEVLPLVQNHALEDPELVDHAAQLLGREGLDWAVDPLLDLMLHAPGEDARYFTSARSLATIGDPRVIPTMIALIAADDTYASRYGIGYFGLTPLTGVPYDSTHDATYWQTWWQTHRSTLPDPVRGMTLPYVEVGD